MNIFTQLARRTGKVIGRIFSYIGGGVWQGGGGVAAQVSTSQLNDGNSTTLALQSSAVWACCRVVSQAVACLPGHVYEQTAEGKRVAREHPYYDLLTSQPNPLMTTMNWLQTTVLHLQLYGNAYTIPETVDGEVIALWPISPDRIRVAWLPATGYTYYWTDPTGKQYQLNPEQLLHFRIFSLDGIVGLSPIWYHRLSFDIDAASRVYSWSLYTNGGRPGGVLEYPGQLSESQIKNIRDSWKQVHGGPLNSGGIVVLEGGVKYSSISIPPTSLNSSRNKSFPLNKSRGYSAYPRTLSALWTNQPTRR